MKKGRILLSALGFIGFSMANAQADQGRVLCYLWANEPSPAINTPYTPNPTYSFSSKHKPISVTKLATGVYEVACIGEGGGPKGPGGHVQVSSYGTGNNVACHVGEWDTSGPDFFAEVDCFGKGGGTGGGPAPADSAFDLLFIR